MRTLFLAPSDFGDEVVYETCVTEWGRSSFLVQHKVYRADGTLGLEIFEKRVWVKRVSETPVTFRSEPIPEEVSGYLPTLSPRRHRDLRGRQPSENNPFNLLS